MVYSRPLVNHRDATAWRIQAASHSNVPSTQLLSAAASVHHRLPTTSSTVLRQCCRQSASCIATADCGQPSYGGFPDPNDVACPTSWSLYVEDGRICYHNEDYNTSSHRQHRYHQSLQPLRLRRL